VANEHVGLIIGKGGRTIREIQANSGAAILIAIEAVDGKRNIRLQGTTEQVEAAREIIS